MAAQNISSSKARGLVGVIESLKNKIRNATHTKRNITHSLIFLVGVVVGTTEATKMGMLLVLLLLLLLGLRLLLLLVLANELTKRSIASICLSRRGRGVEIRVAAAEVV